MVSWQQDKRATLHRNRMNCMRFCGKWRIGGCQIRGDGSVVPGAETAPGGWNRV